MNVSMLTIFEDLEILDMTMNKKIFVKALSFIDYYTPYELIYKIDPKYYSYLMCVYHEYYLGIFIEQIENNIKLPKSLTDMLANTATLFRLNSRNELYKIHYTDIRYNILLRKVLQKL